MTKIQEQRRFGPGWPIRPALTGPDQATAFPGALTARRAYSWYLGAAISLFWVVTMIPDLLRASGSPAATAAALGLVVLFSACFLAAPPLAWTLGMRGRLLVCAGILLLSLCFVPWLGADASGLWTYVGVIVGMCVFPWARTLALIGGLTIVALVWRLLTEPWTESLLIVPVIIASISLMMSAFARTIAVVNELRATQAELESVTAERERGRVARDIHDILGHSLTVIAVKSELASRLMDVDPARARSEIGDVEALARGALADVRATVSGFRGTTASGELVAARGALEAAGIEADLPSTTDVVAAEHRELVGWVIREGVTNVVRHARADRCRIRLSATSVAIDDDGTGPVHPPDAASIASTGLRGLRERVEAAGGRMRVGPSELGGFALIVTLPGAPGRRS